MWQIFTSHLFLSLFYLNHIFGEIKSQFEIPPINPLTVYVGFFQCLLRSPEMIMLVFPIFIGLTGFDNVSCFFSSSFVLVCQCR